MSQAHVNANKTDQRSIAGLFFKDRLATSEVKAVLGVQGDAAEKKNLKFSWHFHSLNRPKLAATSEGWLKTLKLAVKMDDCVDRDLIINASNKAGQHWLDVAKLVIPHLNRLPHIEHHVHDGLGWKTLVNKSNKKRSLDDQNDDDYDEDDDIEEDDDEDMEDEDDEAGEEEDEEEEKCMSKAEEEDDEGLEEEEEEISPSLPEISQKEKLVVSKPAPAKRGRKPIVKEYRLPEDKLVLLNNSPSRPEKFAVFDLSARKKVFSNNSIF